MNNMWPRKRPKLCQRCGRDRPLNFIGIRGIVNGKNIKIEWACKRCENSLDALPITAPRQAKQKPPTPGPEADHE